MTEASARWAGDAQVVRIAFGRAVAQVVATGRLTRIYTAVVAGVVVIALAPDHGSVWAGAAMALMLAGAFAFNDVWDCDADAVNVPSRPIPSGALSRGAAIAITIVCDAGAFAAAVLSRSPRVIGVTLGMIALLILYSIRLKRILVVKNVIMALVGASVPLMGGFSARASQLALILALFILQKEIVADVMDREGDAHVGLRTLPVVLGTRGAMLVVLGVNVAFLASCGLLPFPSGAALAGVAVTNLVAVAVTLRAGSRLSVLRLLRLQQAFLLGGVFFAWM